jgi:glycosyltransferase involved in cell wall biosynthesis
MTVVQASAKAKLQQSPISPHAASDWMSDQGVVGLVSVIVPTYNRSPMLLDLLQSLAAQSWPSLEIIIVDDGSTDDTQDRLTSWQAAHSLPNIVKLKKANAGPAAARNLGLSKARGEFIYFIDSDDLVFPTAIADLVQALEQSRAAYWLASISNTDINSNPDHLAPLEHPQIDFHSVVRSNWMTHAALYRRSAIKLAGPYNEDLFLGEDTELNWRIVAMNAISTIESSEQGGSTAMAICRLAFQNKRSLAILSKSFPIL